MSNATVTLGMQGTMRLSSGMLPLGSFVYSYRVPVAAPCLLQCYFLPAQNFNGATLPRLPAHCPALTRARERRPKKRECEDKRPVTPPCLLELCEWRPSPHVRDTP